MNPQLTVYKYKIFNDHFDPIQLLVRPFYLPNIGLSLIITEVLFFLGSVIFLIKILRHFNFKLSVKFSFIFLYVFSYGTFSALSYPVHPTTWAVLPLTMISFYLLKDNLKGVLFSLFLLLTCKEEFPFVGLALAAYYFFVMKEKRSSLYAFLISFSWLLFAIFGRKVFFDGVMNDHSGRVIKGLFDPINFMMNHYSLRTLKVLFVFILPLAIALFPSTFKGKDFFKALKSNPLTYLVFFPLALRSFSGVWGFQYTIVLSCLLVLFLVFLYKRLEIKNYYFLYFAVFLSIYISNHYFSHRVKRVYKAKTKVSIKCDLRPERYQGLYSYVKQLGENSKILTTGGLAPSLTQKHNRVYTLENDNFKKIENFDYLILETHGSDPYPMSFKKINDLTEKFKEKLVHSFNNTIFIYKL